MSDEVDRLNQIWWEFVYAIEPSLRGMLRHDASLADQLLWEERKILAKTKATLCVEQMRVHGFCTKTILPSPVGPS